MRYAILCLALLVATPATGQNAPRFHNSGTADSSPRYSLPDDYRPVYREPLWRFTYYPNGIPKAGEHKYGFTYWPYSPYRSSLPADHYDRSQSRPYPVR